MTIKYIDVVQEQVTAAEVTIYTVPTTSNFESANIIYANCTNNSGADADLTLNIVQAGGSAAVTNRYFPTSTIFDGSSNPLAPIVGRVLKAGDFIVSLGSAASALNLSIGIKEIYPDI